MKDGDFQITVERNTENKISIAYVEVKYQNRRAVSSCENTDGAIQKLTEHLKRSLLPMSAARQGKENLNGGLENNMAFGKSGKKVAVKKSAAKSNGKAGRKSNFDDAAKITCLHDGNPKRKGTIAAKQFDLYRKKKTVGAFRADKDARMDYLRWDVEHGYIKVG